MGIKKKSMLTQRLSEGVGGGLPEAQSSWQPGHCVSMEAVPRHLSLALSLSCKSCPRVKIKESFILFYFNKTESVTEFIDFDV